MKYWASDRCEAEFEPTFEGFEYFRRSMNKFANRHLNRWPGCGAEWTCLLVSSVYFSAYAEWTCLLVSSVYFSAYAEWTCLMMMMMMMIVYYV